MILIVSIKQHNSVQLTPPPRSFDQNVLFPPSRLPGAYTGDINGSSTNVWSVERARQRKG